MYDRVLVETITTKVCVVGLIPPELVRGNNMETDASQGGIDGSSGCAYFITPDPNSKTASISIWNQEIVPLFEEMQPEMSPVVHFVHPDYREPERDIEHGSNVVLTQSKTGFTYTTKGKQAKDIYDGLSLCWISPHGYVCYWNDISDSSRECDVSTILPLMENEYVTCATYKDYGASGLYLIGTSEKRTWQMWKNTRPLELQARLLLSDDMHNYIEDKSSEGFLSGIYSRIFTPSKPSKPIMNQVASGVDDKSILAIFDLPCLSPISSPSPAKMKKLSHPNRAGGNSFLYTVSRNGSVQTWLSSYSVAENMHVGQTLHHLHVSSCLESKGSAIKNIEVLAADIDQSKGVAAISLCVKACIDDMYKLFLVYLPINVDSGVVSKGSCAWLGRFSSQTLSSDSNSLKCTGLVATFGINSVMNVYCSFQAERPGSFPVTVSSVRFMSASNFNPQPIDTDLPEHIIREMVPGTLQYDNLNDGCIFISNQGCVTSVLVNDIASNAPREGFSLSSEINVDMVDVLVNHLFSEFQSHLRRVQENLHQFAGSPRFEASSPYAKKAESLLPQSIITSDNKTLSEAVVRVSTQYMDDFGTSAHASMVEEKRRLHIDFLDWLHRSGIYKRISVSGRIALCDHGEKISVVEMLLCNVPDIIDAVPGENGTSFKKLLNHFLTSIQRNVSNLPEELLTLQQSIQNDEPDSVGVDIMLEICSSVAYQAELYRSNSCSKMYDIGQDLSIYHVNAACPWTSSQVMLRLMDNFCKWMMRSKFDDRDIEWGKVVLISKTLLNGYKSVPASSRNDEEYDDSKKTVFDLLSEILPEPSKTEDDLIFNLSLEHSYFHGIVQTCHNYSKFGTFHHAYDLKALMDPLCTKLDHKVRDFGTGLTFQKFVLRWYVDRNMYGSALSIGQRCPSILSEYIDEDERMSHLQWIQQIKSEQYQECSKSLWSLKTEGITAFSEQLESTLEGKKLVLSLAKVGSLSSITGLANLRAVIEDELELCRCQEGIGKIILDNEISLELPRDPLDSESLMKISIQLSKSLDNKESIARACLVGLSISNIMVNDLSITDVFRMEKTRDLWLACINADRQAWEHLTHNWDNMSDNQRKNLLKTNVCIQVAQVVESEKLSETVGFDLVLDDVMQKLNLKDLDRIIRESLTLMKSQ
jgi:hypothetical protein